MADKNDKFIMVDKMDEMKPIKKKKIYIVQKFFMNKIMILFKN